MEDRSIWLPPGLEGGRLEPDDRASQSSLGNGGSRRQAANASARGNGAPKRDPKRDDPEPKPADREPAERESAAAEEADAADQPRGQNGGASDADPPRPPDERRGGGGDGGGEDEGGREPQRKHRPSAVDAMGQDKHREVVGQRYGLSRSRQFLYYGIFFAFVVAAYLGLKTAANELDKAPAHDPDQAPWSKPNAPQAPLGGFEPSSPGQRGPTDFQ